MAVSGTTTLIVKPDMNAPVKAKPSQAPKSRRQGKPPHSEGQMLFPTHSSSQSGMDGTAEANGVFVNGLGRTIVPIPAALHSAAAN
ncbi:MAG: hypothetical protein ABI036_14850 [Fibrobacteria bacterium]